MIKRNLASIFVIASCVLGILNIDFSNISAPPNEYWLLIFSSLIILASIIFTLNTESKFNKNK
ncbi:hypothetical protein JCM19274_1512 [Algibacter lectus]|uniref:Uncharacterized protein n=1 Tax=Algibacter lectus TaxID=221126 RepID=A0A090WV57_9FLAO|nr:hypothetical protein JCM19274_1512 [Algibacter lectus]